MSPAVKEKHADKKYAKAARKQLKADFQKAAQKIVGSVARIDIGKKGRVKVKMDRGGTHARVRMTVVVNASELAAERLKTGWAIS